MLQAYQQTCLMNWSFIFEQWLYNRHLSTGTAGLYELVYQSMYLLPLILMFVIYLVLIRADWFDNYEAELNMIGLIYLIWSWFIVNYLSLCIVSVGIVFIVTLLLFVLVVGWFEVVPNGKGCREKGIKNNMVFL